MEWNRVHSSVWVYYDEAEQISHSIVGKLMKWNELLLFYSNYTLIKRLLYNIKICYFYGNNQFKIKKT